MTDIVERLDEPEAHYPGNFDTPKRANAMLSCLCQEAKDEIESLRQRLADMTSQRDFWIEEEGKRQQDTNAVVQDVSNYAATLEQQLAASQAREQQLREALEYHRDVHVSNIKAYQLRDAALALPQDTTALSAIVAKAGEVMRERCESMLRYQGGCNLDLLRAIPGVTMEDLKGGAS